jgi:putative YphP/YqiW family bacilliredoxin
MAQINLQSLMGNQGPSYSEILVRPYREELTGAGFEELLTPEQVEHALNRHDKQVVLVVLNSVCGCSARVGRPGTLLSLLHGKVPDHLVTIFAGMEKEAVSWFREKYLEGLTPSSPNIAIFRDGDLLHILHRHQIERMTATEIAADLKAAFDRFCNKSQTTTETTRLRHYFMERYQEDPFQLPNEQKHL